MEIDTTLTTMYVDLLTNKNKSKLSMIVAFKIWYYYYFSIDWDKFHWIQNCTGHCNMLLAMAYGSPKKQGKNPLWCTSPWAFIHSNNLNCNLHPSPTYLIGRQTINSACIQLYYISINFVWTYCHIVKVILLFERVIVLSLCEWDGFAKRRWKTK